MRKLLLALLLLPALAISQDKISTSEEEYKYLTEGLKIAHSTGGDLKNGYTFDQIGADKSKSGEFTVTYSLFKNTETKKTKAVSIILKKEKDKKDKEIYLCLPINNPELLNKFFEQTESLGLSMKVFFDRSIYNFLQKSVNKVANE